MARQWQLDDEHYINEDSSGNEWQVSGEHSLNEESGFDAQRQNIIDGLDGSLATGTSWDTVKASIPVGNVVRTDNTVTITIPALASYDIVTQETVTAKPPATALVISEVDLEAAPVLTIDVDPGASGNPHYYYAQQQQ